MPSKPEWLKELLDNVPTTKEQAKIILKRNQELLTWLEERRPEFENQTIAEGGYCVDIGCPHCNKHFICTNCAYNSKSSYPEMFACIFFEFDGLTYEDVNGSDIVNLTYGHSHAKIVTALYEFDANKWADSYNNVVKFLKAHILWAEEVIKGED